MARISPSGRRYGWVHSKPDHRDNIYSAGLIHTASLPTSVDLRPQMPPVYDQGSLGACSSHAFAAALEYELKRQKLADMVPSRLFIYYNERALENTIESDSGADLRDGIKTLVKQGFCDEKLWPYTISKFAQKPDSVCYSSALKDLITGYSSVPQAMSTAQSALASGLPIVFGFTVYESFESEEVSATGIVPMPRSGEASLGGHAVIAVGYDSSLFGGNGGVIVRNSWGQRNVAKPRSTTPDGSNWGWGLDGCGHFLMPYSYFFNPQLAGDFWVIKNIA